MPSPSQPKRSCTFGGQSLVLDGLNQNVTVYFCALNEYMPGSLFISIVFCHLPPRTEAASCMMVTFGSRLREFKLKFGMCFFLLSVFWCWFLLWVLLLGF